MPHLLGLAAASNIGSAMTLVGNPQNILISEVMDLSFARYFLVAVPICILGLFWCFWVIHFSVNGRWRERKVEIVSDLVEFDRWQVIKGLIVMLCAIAFFFFSSVPRYQVALAAAGVILLSRKMATKKMLGFVDWQFFVLFMGLFLVKAAFFKTEISEATIGWMTGRGIDMSHPGILFGASFLLSNLVSNVPAVMLLLPFTKSAFLGTVLALSSTLAGNLMITGSLANLIVIQKARDEGIKISFLDHLKVGMPVILQLR